VEERNVHVSGYLYACSREADNDFHLIVGCRLRRARKTYMTMESQTASTTILPTPELNAARKPRFQDIF